MKALFLTSFLLILTSCYAQERKVGGPCEGCEAIYEYDVIPTKNVDTIPGYAHAAKKLKVHGTVYEKGGKSPANGVIIYIYQTNDLGIYKACSGARGWGKRHGRHRGWVRTNRDRKYAFYTFMPGAYPDGTEAAHIHVVVKETGKSEYYIDNIIFEEMQQAGRGGSGVSIPRKTAGILSARRDIILGLNIPDYD